MTDSEWQDSHRKVLGHGQTHGHSLCLEEVFFKERQESVYT